MMLPGATSVSYEFDTKTLNAAGQIFFERLAWLCGTVVLAFAIIVLLGRFITPSFAGFNRFVLHGNEQNGYLAVDNPVELPKPGSNGEVSSTLRPTGKVIINDIQYDAVSTGSMIEKGSPITVVRLDGSIIIVTLSPHSSEESQA